MMNGASDPVDPIVGENVFGKHTSIIGSIHIKLMDIVVQIEKERVELLVPYAFDEDILTKNDKTKLSILDALLKEFRNSMIGIELYGQMK